MKNIFIKSLFVLGAVFAIMSTATCEETVPVLMPDGKVVSMPVNPTPAEKEQIRALQLHFESNPANATSNTNTIAQHDKMNSCINTAISRGYSLDEIAQTLLAHAGIDPAVVRARGYDSAEIIAKLGSTCLEKDFAVKSFEWYQKAAVQGNAVAQTNLGEMYFFGQGVPEDAVKAAEWYQKAAARGNVVAQIHLGVMYERGLGVPRDSAKAVEWLQKAAVQGNDSAQYFLGSMYQAGDGIPKDAAKALEWYRKAAAQGFPVAQYALGVMYDSGDGVPKDATKAVEWYLKAAAQGYAPPPAEKKEMKIEVKIKYVSDPPGAVLYFDDALKGKNTRGDYTPYYINYPISFDDGAKADAVQTATLPATIRWQSGATVSAKIHVVLNRDKHLLSLRSVNHDHTEIDLGETARKNVESTFTFKRPNKVSGRAADEEFALKVQAMRDAEDKAINEHNLAVTKAEIDAINAKQRRESDEQLGLQTELMKQQKELLEQQQLQNIMLQQNEQLHQIGIGMGGLLGGGFGQAVQPPPVSHSINCTSRALGGQVYTNCY